jgi:hypothetical protein
MQIGSVDKKFEGADFNYSNYTNNRPIAGI